VPITGWKAPAQLKYRPSRLLFPSRPIHEAPSHVPAIRNTSRVIGRGSISKVVAIFDGDTLEVLHNHHPERVRLSGIDCPEKGQAYGSNAKHAASDLAFVKEVTAQIHDHDKYKGNLGEVLLPDGMNLNQELVRDGWCWRYRKYGPGDTVLEELAQGAREGRKNCGPLRNR
jgi:endonuclease YncB( thermonuclease family)